jgi:enoyl-CoA hydratase/long-chain 3-hydroxyacyl-CoA dehydrogenase
VATALDLAAGKAKAKQRKKGWMDTLLEGNPLGRKVMFDKAKEQVMKATKGKMPAPLNIIECVKAGLEGGHSSGSKVEARRFGELAASSESAALRGLFFGQTAAKKNVFGQPPKRVETVGVLGAGLMGAGIAEVSAAKDIRVLLKDQNVAGLSRGEGQIKKNLDGKHKKKRISTYERDAMLSRVTGLTDNDSAWAKHFGQADMVIEAVFEDMSVKHKVVAEMEAVLPPHAIIASNTSTLPIGEIAAKAARPENIVGMHYFSPVDKMPLLEVIPHAGTSKEVCAAAVDVGLRQGKTVIAVKDVPGFYVNRCLGPCMVEACALLQQGADPQKLNEAMPKAGYPVGVLSLCDEVGIDVANKVVGNLIGEQPKFLGVRMEGADLGMLKAFVDKGLLGRKAGAGFYDYSVKEKKKPINKAALDVIAQFRDASNSSAEGLGLDELNERLMLRFVKEAVHCLESGVIETAREGDIGAVFGVGFPPFLGGPFMYVDAVGAKTVVAAMDRLAAQHGEQFAPPDLLKKHADEGKPFHA